MKKIKNILPIICACTSASLPLISMTNCGKGTSTIALDGEPQQTCDENGLLSYTFKINDKVKDNRVHVLLNSNTANLQLQYDIVSVDQENNAFYVPIWVCNANESGEIKFGLTFTYYNAAGNPITATFNNLIAKFSALDVKPLYLSIEGQTYVANDQYNYSANFFPVNTKNKDVVWSYSAGQGVYVQIDNPYDGKFTFSGSGNVTLTCTSRENDEVYNTIEVTVLSNKDIPIYKFCNDSWENLCEVAKGGLEKLMEHYGFENQYQLLGLERYIKIGKAYHRVRVIGLSHDTAGTEKTALTFEMANVVTDVSGARKSYWNERTSAQASSDNYLDSFLREVLTGESPSVTLIDPTCLQLLEEGNPELGKNLKKVNKTVTVRQNGQYKLESYETKLFPLSAVEFGLPTNPEWPADEGTTYEYYANMIGKGNWKKTDSYGNPTAYWGLSPSKADERNALHFDDSSGSPSGATADQLFGVSFAFCI